METIGHYIQDVSYQSDMIFWIEGVHYLFVCVDICENILQ